MAGNKLEEMEDVEKKEDGIIEDIAPEMQMKHPLQNTWTLWYYENDRTKSWEENQREITSFDTAEDFWSLYNHIKTASELRQDKYWLEILLCMIGEAFDEHSEDVCGAVVNIRSKGDKIGLWTADGLKGQSIMKIGEKLKQRLNIGRNVAIGYQIHKDTMVKSGSITKNTYTL
ncbi:hypothetical protein L9F63_023546 [Diploptera punctata]|uniref:EIF-4F 25 kDa subunit n=1 Tax=Diploptera punctata TaxID=6984 RepID=A0AAD7ZIE4_DIPPU|nr:hypothetical protein L9F63_023546 [Diploptera punctata]